MYFKNDETLSINRNIKKELWKFMLNITTLSINLLDLLISFIENYLIILLIDLFFSKKKNMSFITAIIFTVISQIVNYLFYPPIYSSLILLLLLYIYTFCLLDGPLNYKLFAPLLVFANILITSILISLIFIFFTNNSKDFISSLNFEYFMISIFQIFILFFEYLFIKKHKNNELYVTNETWFLSFILILISVSFPITLYNEYLKNNINSIFIVFMSLIEFVVNNILVCCILYRLNKDGKKITEQQILLETRKYDEKLYDLINDRIDEMNKVNHDMRQHMLVIEKMLENNDNVEVSNYINNIPLNIPPIQINTSNKILNYLLSEKIKTAQALGIDVKCLIQGNLENILSPVDLSINIYKDKYKLTISVINSYNGTIIKNKNTFITTKKDKKSHGYGIKNIEHICQKYNGYHLIEHDNHTFTHICTFILSQ